MYERDIENNGQELLKASSVLHMHPETLKRRLREWRTNSDVVKTVESIIPYSSSRIYTDYFRVPGDNWLLISDIEFPDHHAQTLRYALLTAKAHNIKKLAILGDTLASDQGALNHWPAAWMPDPEQPYHMIVRFLKRVLRDLTEWFPEGVWIISGNHDERLPKALNGNLDLGVLIEDIPGVHFSNYRYMWIDTSRGPVYACHQQNFSKNPIKVGQDIYDILEEKAHVVVTHIHRRESGTSKDGTHEIHALGTCRDLTAFDAITHR